MKARKKKGMYWEVSYVECRERWQVNMIKKYGIYA